MLFANVTAEKLFPSAPRNTATPLCDFFICYSRKTFHNRNTHHRNTTLYCFRFSKNYPNTTLSINRTAPR